MELIYIAEGSDWFWWYGADQNSGSDDSFGQQFRGYLEQIYTLLGSDIPDFVYVPIIPKAAQSPDREPEDLLSITADGIAEEGEWDDAGFYSVSDGVISGFHYGFDQKNLFLRVDVPAGFSDDHALGFYMSGPGSGASNAYSHYGAGETLLGFGVKRLIEVTFDDGLPEARIFSADGAGGWKQLDPEVRVLEEAAVGEGLLEIVAPFAQFLPDARSGDRINMRLVLSDEGTDTTVVPSSGPALATVPDLPITNVFLELSDPSNDDNGPGYYVYPGDAVFKISRTGAQRVGFAQRIEHPNPRCVYRLQRANSG
jgi:hypothetical protein